MSNRRPLVAGNWKLHYTLAESRALAAALKSEIGAGMTSEVVIAPVFTALAAVAAELQGSPIGLSAQNVHSEASGAYTGEVSAPLLVDVGCRYCIVGHSERRQLFGETDAGVHAKLSALLGCSVAPILCVGETLEQREAGTTFDVVLGQLDRALEGLDAGRLESLVVAYEPVWAIGTGKNASPADAQAVHSKIRARIAETKGAPLAESLRILYGGSVKPDNAADLLAQSDVDGALVGGASLKVETFLPIVRAA
ncbi:MAG: triose-phosphate isomerase [Polyangiaceae bacterium]|nr:triose-phosphate isomerase [Polyangiaceae bacterium]